MGKRGNTLGHLRKEEAEEALEQSSEVPKGPFAKASDEVMKKRRIVRSARKFKANRTPTGSAGGTGNSIFSGVALSTTPAAGGNPFGGFSFGASSSTPAPAAKKPSFPSFATPAASAKPTFSKPYAASSIATDSNDKIDQATNAFFKHLESLGMVDSDCLQQFISTVSALSDNLKTKPKAKTSEKPKASASSTSWDSSRPLFGGTKPLVSPTGSSSAPATTAKTTNLFGAGAPSPAPASGGFSFNSSKPAASPSPAAAGGFSFNTSKPAAAPMPAAGGFSFNTSSTTAAPSPAAGGFSFNPTKTGAATAPVPAFSFSTTQSTTVKEAAKAAAASTAAKSDDADEKKEEEEAGGELEAANDDYEVLYRTKTKILRVSKNMYIKGTLKLEKHKESGKSRLAVRDAVTGKVKMNSAISKGMPLSKGIVPATKKKPPTPIVVIKTLFDEESKDPEDFKIIVANDEHEKLYKELSNLV